MNFTASYLVDVETGCWNWTRGKSSNGYGKLTVGGKEFSAHRYSWEHSNGPIPPGMGYHGTCVLHRCDNRACVNPGHLFLGTPLDNALDRESKGRRYKFGVPRGETHPMAKLCVADVERIKEASLFGASALDLAGIYGVSRAAIYSIRSGRKWAAKGTM